MSLIKPPTSQNSPEYVELSPSPRRSSSITLPGSKSFTNRALIISALAEGCSTLLNPSESEDSQALLNALVSLKAISVDKIILNEEVAWKITGHVRHQAQGSIPHSVPPTQIDIGPAGTAMRFLTALCAAWDGCDVILRGSSRMHERPIADLVNALKHMGAEISYLGAEGCPPLHIRGHRLKGRDGRLKELMNIGKHDYSSGDTLSAGSSTPKLPIKIPGSTSSQFISALLMVAPLLEEGLSLEVSSPLVSASYVEMTIETMAQFGVKVSCIPSEKSDLNDSPNRGLIFDLPPQSLYLATTYQIEADGSGASYLWAIGAISGQYVRVNGINLQSTQADILFPKLLEQMGCKVVSGSERPQVIALKNLGFIEVSGPSTSLKPISADLSLMPDCAQTLAVLAALAPGTSVLSGLKTLRFKETDRLAALSNELQKLGIRSDITADTITIHGKPPAALREISPLPSVDTYDDHRMAMAFSVIGATIPGLRINDPRVVNKSFPNFWRLISELGIAASFST